MTIVPISPEVITGQRPDYLPAYVLNGVIGLRVREIPLLPGVAIVNGLTGIDPTEHIESTPYAPYPLNGDIQLGAVELSQTPYCARFIDQFYDFSCGELHSRFAFAADGVEAQARVLTFCSRSNPTLVLQETELKSMNAFR